MRLSVSPDLIHSIVDRSSAGFTSRPRASLTMTSSVGLRRDRSKPLMYVPIEPDVVGECFLG